MIRSMMRQVGSDGLGALQPVRPPLRHKLKVDAHHRRVRWEGPAVPLAHRAERIAIPRRAHRLKHRGHDLTGPLPVLIRAGIGSLAPFGLD